MEGKQVYDCSTFHPDCPTYPIDIGGYPWLWCPDCKVLVNLQAVSAKFDRYAEACLKGARATRKAKFDV